MHLFNQNTKNSLSNIRAHYDLSNQFYQTFLDQYDILSYYDSKPLSLEAAQRNKINHILVSEMREGDALLEIGTGWEHWH